MYLCYDIKGIQRFIYSVPKLKCVIGASGLIAGLDDHARGLARDGVQPVFCAGGRGAYQCVTEDAADTLEDQLIGLAHDVGLDIRIGRAAKLSDAAQHADELHPFCPSSLEGFPCEASGLWPVEEENGIHPLIVKRIQEARDDFLGNTIAGRIEDAEILELTAQRHLRFIRNVNPDPKGESPEDLPRDEQIAKAGQTALGNRNRWAVIAMDGNDMGKQFSSFMELVKGSPNEDERLRDWSREMSQRLEACTRNAFETALQSVVKDWLESASDAGRLADCIVQLHNGDEVVLAPFRPLILGGDDVVMLCHSSYALTFVEAMATEFQRLSREAAKNATCQPLWPATGTELSISAGILFCKTTFPLHLALPYAESLLGNAKSQFRKHFVSGKRPTPAAVDWDVITDSLVDTPTERRNRELRFKDQELPLAGGEPIEIRLTQRPYLLLEQLDGHDSLRELFTLRESLRELPKSIQAQLLPALRRPWSERTAFFASIAKRHKRLKELLWEDGGSLGEGWTPSEKYRATGVPDALMLLEEDHRMTQTN